MRRNPQPVEISSFSTGFTVYLGQPLQNSFVFYPPFKPWRVIGGVSAAARVGNFNVNKEQTTKGFHAKLWLPERSDFADT